jgi:hypothetical protein
MCICAFLDKMFSRVGVPLIEVFIDQGMEFHLVSKLE